MSKLGKRMVSTAWQAVAIASTARRAGRSIRSSGCVFCDINLPVIDRGTRPYHEARDRGKIALVPCTRRCPPDDRVVTGRKQGGRPPPPTQRSRAH
jgi:hypothetical protein